MLASAWLRVCATHESSEADMIDLKTERPIPLAEAARLVPAARNGKRCHESTLFRWITKGIRGVKLEALRLGGRWVTSREALQRFAERLTPDLEATPRPVPRSPARRRRASERAAKELERIGI
jgi:hypothetical protein